MSYAGWETTYVLHSELRYYYITIKHYHYCECKGINSMFHFQIDGIPVGSIYFCNTGDASKQAKSEILYDFAFERAPGLRQTQIF